MMRAIKIDPSNRSIEEIELAIDPNRSLSELQSIIGAEELELIPLDKGFNLLADLHGEQKPSFGFFDLDEPVINGVTVASVAVRIASRRFTRTRPASK